MNQSIWREGAELPRFPEAQGDMQTDVLIIGGGLCGILCAYFLEWAGVDYILAEAGRIGQGITGNTTAKVTAQHGLLYSRLMREAGREKAQLYLAANQEALERYTQLCQNIDCDFERKAAYTYSLTDRQALEDEARAVRTLGGEAEYVEKLPLPFETAGAVKMRCQAQFHPLKFLAGVSKGLRIFENTRITELGPKTAVYGNGEITAKKMIVTTHFPFLNKHGGYFAKLYQYRSYVLALENAPKLDGMFVGAEQNGLSFRGSQDLLLVGGGGHRTGKQGGNWEALRRFAQRYYPDARERCAWATQDCMSLDGIPYIGQYSGATPDLYVAAGFNKWGMTTSMAAALLLRDMVMERENEYEPLFSPQRSMRKRQLLANGLEAVHDLLIPSDKRCPHLGCALQWNAAEHSWDCPCHGSRFDITGKLIDNPATGGARIAGKV